MSKEFELNKDWLAGRVEKNRRYFILVRIFVNCSECGIGGHYEYRKLQSSQGQIYHFTEYEAQKYIETYGKVKGSLQMQEVV